MPVYLPLPELVSVCLPFSGFDYSQWSDLVDHEAEQWLEYIDEEPSRYSPAERLCHKKGLLGDLLAEHTNDRAAYANIGKDYSEAYLWWLAESLGFPVTVIETPMTSTVREGYTWVNRQHIMPVAWAWEEVAYPGMCSGGQPARLFAKVDAVLLRELYRQLMLVDNSWAFDRTVKEMFTSYDGFHSFYPNDPEVFKAKPLADWDHNELQVLFHAWAGLQFKFRGSYPCAKLEDELYDQLSEGGHAYFDNAVDWDELAASCRIAVDDMLDDDELTETERHDLEHPRCTETLELPL